MEARTNWGIVAVAAAFVLIAIGVALSTSYFEKTPETVAPVAVTESSRSAEPSADWMGVLNQIATTSVDAQGNYIAPKELAPTDRISQELVVSYLQLKNDGSLTETEKNKKFQEIIARDVTPVTPTEQYTLGSIKISNVDLPTYAGALTETLARSAEVKEYELTTFARTIGQKNNSGTPALAAAAAVYRGIERDLARMPVPSDLAGEHLAVLESVATLAQTNELMAKWSGDPVVGLTYVDAFYKADKRATVTVNALYQKLVKLANKQS